METIIEEHMKKIAKEKRFYEQDEEKYEVKKNKEFLSWYNSIIKNGYKKYLDLDQIQNVIDTIVNWYEIKYPNEWILEHSNGKAKELSEMNTTQLLVRMHHGLQIPDIYRASGGGTTHIKINGEYKTVGTSVMDINIIDEEMRLKELNECLPPYFILAAYSETGKVRFDWYLQNYFECDENSSLEDILSLFEEKYSDKFDYSELKECVYNHECDIELKNRVLQLTALKMLYSEKTNSSDGYKRAKKFIKEFNEELGLELSTTEIDELYNKEYSSDNEIKKTPKKKKNLINIFDYKKENK